MNRGTPNDVQELRAAALAYLVPGDASVMAARLRKALELCEHRKREAGSTGEWCVTCGAVLRGTEPAAPPVGRETPAPPETGARQLAERIISIISKEFYPVNKVTEILTEAIAAAHAPAPDWLAIRDSKMRDEGWDECEAALKGKLAEAEATFEKERDQWRYALINAVSAARSWHSEFSMYRGAWLREMGGEIRRKAHEIDGFVLRARDIYEAAQKWWAHVRADAARGKTSSSKTNTTKENIEDVQSRPDSNKS